MEEKGDIVDAVPFQLSDVMVEPAVGPCFLKDMQALTDMPAFENRVALHHPH